MAILPRLVSGMWGRHLTSYRLQGIIRQLFPRYLILSKEPPLKKLRKIRQRVSNWKTTSKSISKAIRTLVAQRAMRKQILS